MLNETALVDLPAAVRHNTLRDMERAMFGLLSMPGVNLEEATAHLTELETELVAYATARAEAIVASALDDIRVTRGAQDT